MTMRYEDYYKVLGVARDATPEEIQKAFRKLARQYHPDINKEPGAEDQFKKLNEAYEVLKDPENRKKYDALGANWRQGQTMNPPPGWGGGFPGGGGGGGDFSDFFSAFFGGGGGAPGGFQFNAGPGGFGGGGFGGGFGGAPRPRKGQDHEVEVTVSLQDVFHGGVSEVALRVQEASGQVHHRTHKVRIPAGTTDGKVLRLAGLGSPGANGGPSGDLRLRVRIAPDPTFSPDGHDLTARVKVEPWKAALGGQVEVPTLEGPVSMKIPAGVQGGQRLRLRGKGLPRGGKHEPGDLYAQLEISIPRDLSDEARRLYEALRALEQPGGGA